MITIGGGEVVTAHAALRRRGAAAAQAVVAEEGSGFEGRLAAALLSAGPAGTTVEALAMEVGEGRDRVAAQVLTRVAAQEIIDLRGRLFSNRAAERIQSDVLAALAAYHATTAWRRGIPRDELKTQVFGSGDDRLYGHALDALAGGGRISIEAGFVRLGEFHPSRSSTETAAHRAIEDAFRSGRYAPPARDDALARLPDRAVAERMLQVLLDDGLLVNVGGEIIFHREVLGEIETQVAAYVGAHGEITVAALRDQLGTSRKYALAVLEYFDATHLTRRVGDKRVLARASTRP
jgi:selenocysteine-specific elongation factor